ncbi:UPF0228 family protein [Methanosarcina mazei]|nr:UPF0228 family protein [Methanosarcina mazei]
MTTNYSIDCNTGSMGNKYYIMVDKDNRDIRRELRMKKFVWCYIRFEKPDGFRYWIPEEDAVKMKNELENNESIITVSIDYINDQ